jgi:Subtilisin inhibitor-like
MRLEGPRPVRAAGRLLAVALPILALIIGCGGQITEPPGPNPRSTTMPDSPSSLPPSDPDVTDLTIVFDNGSGETRTWRLSCEPPGGTHPDPDAACRVLEANGAAALPPVPKDKLCTQIYGGPETASITGTWKGEQVLSRFARNDGCQIGRWKLMEGLLPRAGS